MTVRIGPGVNYADTTEPYSWLCWADLNHDGKVDLVKSVWLNEPSFLPGHPSGKVLVATHIADEHGRIAAEPQQVFRKNDWTGSVARGGPGWRWFPGLGLGYSHMDTREGMRKEITAKQLDYTLRFYFYRPGSGFPKEADCQRDLVIHLDQASLLLSWGRSQFFEHSPVSAATSTRMVKPIAGAGPKRCDLGLLLCVARESFSLKPDLRFSCPEQIDGWQVKDLNNDGVSDLIVKLGKQNGYRVFISQKP